MILIAYRHGLRVSELCRLEWSQIDFASGLLRVVRLKGSISTTHPLRGIELRALRRLKREQEPSRHVWITERDAPMTAGGFRQMLRRTGRESGLGFPVHPHMLQARLRLQNRQREPRHPSAAALSRPQGHPPHRPLQRAVQRRLQRLLEGLTVHMITKQL